MMVGVRSTEQGWTDNEIRYDGLASRASLFDSTGMTYFAWDGIRVLKLEDGDGDLVQRQIHGYAPIESVGDIVQMESGGSEYVPVADQVGTLWRVLNSSASAANSYSYDAFGVGRSVSETFTNPFRFAGKTFDADPALCHFIAREYYGKSGAFLSRDRPDKTIGTILLHFGIAWPGGISAVEDDVLRKYLYVGAMPLTAVDVRGEQRSKPTDCCGANINDILAVLEYQVTQKFARAGWLRKNLACRGIYGFIDPGRYPYVPAFVNAWDIDELFQPEHMDAAQASVGCATGECARTVWLRGGCHTPQPVNYVMFGWVNRLCWDFCPWVPPSPGLLPSLWMCTKQMHSRSAVWTAAYAWARATHGLAYAEKAVAWAYHGYGDFGSVPPPDREECVDCGKKYPGEFHAYWIRLGWIPSPP